MCPTLSRNIVVIFKFENNFSTFTVAMSNEMQSIQQVMSLIQPSLTCPSKKFLGVHAVMYKLKLGLSR